MTTKINNEHKKLNVPNKREQNQTCLDSAEREGLRPKGNVPNLRFPEFQGEWEKMRLDAFTKRVMRKNKSNQSRLPLTISAQYGLVDQITFFNKVVASTDLSNYYLLKKGEFAYNKSYSSDYPWGAIKRLDNYDQGALSSLYICFAPQDSVVSDFILQYFESPKWHKGISEIAVEGARNHGLLNVAVQDFFHTYHYVPKDKKEQFKISKLLILLDERIATQNKIIEDLKKLKSAIVEKVFCSPNQEYPMCRIEGFEHALSTYKMSDFSSRIASKNKDSKCSLVLTIAAQYGLVNQESFFNKSVASDNLTGYYLLHKGEFAYNRSYSAGYDWGAVKRLDNYDEGVLSTLYICFKINETIVDSDYLAYYFESSKWHKGLSDIAGEGARNHGLLNVSITDYFNTKHRFPVIEEQKAIAKMLNTITEKERKATLLGECYQKQKQYLLCQMFI